MYFLPGLFAYKKGPLYKGPFSINYLIVIVLYEKAFIVLRTLTSDLQRQYLFQARIYQE